MEDQEPQPAQVIERRPSRLIFHDFDYLNPVSKMPQGAADASQQQKKAMNKTAGDIAFKSPKGGSKKKKKARAAARRTTRAGWTLPPLPGCWHASRRPLSSWPAAT